jgi:hypothetical protein
VSGILEVQVTIWTCSYTYTPDNPTLSNILVSTTSPSWVKATYTNPFTIKYDQFITALGKTQPYLLYAMDVDRLDECLTEWQNSIAILIKDMARCSTDGVSLCANTGQKFTKWTINIDNSTPKLQLSGDLITTFLSGGTVIDWVTSQDIWRNYTLSWTIKAWEEYEWGTSNECKSFSWALTWQCSGSLVWGQIWTSPSGVTLDGKFMQYTCDDLWPFPTDDDCEMWCPTWKIWNPNTSTCEDTACKAFVWWSPVVIEHGVNWVVNGSSCMAYCIPWHSVGCVVKTTNAVNWQCWSANGTTVWTVPTANLCNTGTASSVTWTWPWNWTCNGSNGWTNASCSANETVVVTEFTYSWDIWDRWACNADCWWWTQRKYVGRCRRSDGVWVADSNCWPKPEIIQSCNTHSCCTSSNNFMYSDCEDDPLWDPNSLNCSPTFLCYKRWPTSSDMNESGVWRFSRTDCLIYTPFPSCAYH